MPPPAPKPKPSRRPTIRDVSRLAGVSHMTVSRVISEPGIVLPETRSRVLAAIADLGYVPDRTAGGLSSRRSGFVALVLPTLTNANFSTVAHGLTESLRAGGYDLLIAYTKYDLAEEERLVVSLLARRPEAIIVTGSRHTPGGVRRLVNAGVPVIEIADLPTRPIQHAVGFSNESAGRLAARHLVARGFTRIAGIGSQVGASAGDFRGEDRLRGFEDELRLAGLSNHLVLRRGLAPVGYGHGAEAMAHLIEAAPDVEAVFAVSDLSAVGAVMECQRRRVDVPGRVSIMGFGDFDIGRQVNPALTTIHVDFLELGRRAGGLAAALIAEGDFDQPRVVDVGLTLVERASVGGSHA